MEAERLRKFKNAMTRAHRPDLSPTVFKKRSKDAVDVVLAAFYQATKQLNNNEAASVAADLAAMFDTIRITKIGA